MSRFFATGSDSESSTESSDEETQPTRSVPARKPQFAFSDDEEEKRVVRSQKDKRSDELKDIIHSMRNRQKIRDIVKVQNEFEVLQKAYVKSKSVLDTEDGPPRFFIKSIGELEDFVQTLWEDKEAKQKLSKINSKALASLKQKVRKYNKDFEVPLKHFRENPELYEEEEEQEQDKDEDEDDDDDIEESKAPPPEAPPSTKADGYQSDDDDDDDSSWGSSSDSESSSDSDERGNWAPGEYRYTAEYFLKKKPTSGVSDEVKPKRRERKEKETKETKEVDEEEEQEEGEKWETVQRKGIGRELTDKEKMKSLFGKENVELDGAAVAKKRNELISARGKKSTDRPEQIRILKYLLDLANAANLGSGVTLRLLLDIIDAAFDVPSGGGSLKDEIWKLALDYLVKVLQLLESNPSLEMNPLLPDEDINYTDLSRPLKLQGNLLAYLERMNEEFIKILQSTDAHSTDYLTKLQAERRVTDIVDRTLKYLEKQSTATEDANLCRIYIMRIDHLYYKVDRDNYGKPVSQATEEGEELNSAQLIAKLAKFIYNYPGIDLGPIKTRAVLCHIYHHALHNRWFEARDLMLMSHLQEGIQHADVPTQILYNRTIVQLGMCAFRHGMIKESHETLMDIHSPSRSKETKAKELAKELLAQGLTPRPDRTLEQEKLERRRQVPFHMHINLELMECVYLTSAMLLEIPYMAATETEGRRRMISKGFYHQLKNHEKQPLVGPPETMREHVVAAANSMKKGNWIQARDYLLNIKAWNLFTNVEEVKAMLTSKIQEETLRTYIFTYGSVYDSLSLHRLSEMFELPLATVHSIISRMIIKEELLASLDEPTQCVVMHHAKPTKLQSLALNLAEKIGTVADHHEELLKVKQGPGWMIGGGGLTFPSTKGGGYGRRKQAS
ncbi:PREDICTED: eukaryotic translation initiation factor 3 subunit C-like [Amphimedon queenslandica]|uniref:Eukaryotic translation initiation factor 3 subunit C n=1 Tax=Amphimedon queenslandica TaxID=400682 RepID=A0A1X7V277_AMPQE|nr:PREDICTED: eukaryotic translation initiation factor 3 subunit C-like [Amphimedon queenslandica]|eukprot:XP_011403348.1 PREDICTED: eukaryotic translation initiation factor 3 subunit C-like [Amphimedon queenslandica]